MNDLLTQVLRQPIVFEDFVEEGPHLNVNVVWDRWRGVPSEVRMSIIRDSYLAARSKDYEKLLVANGLTGAEARDMGLLPYEVAGGEFDESKASSIGDPFEIIGKARYLFPDRTSAEEACKRLNFGTLGSPWKIEQKFPAD